MKPNPDPINDRNNPQFLPERPPVRTSNRQGVGQRSRQLALERLGGRTISPALDSEPEQEMAATHEFLTLCARIV